MDLESQKRSGGQSHGRLIALFASGFKHGNIVLNSLPLWTRLLWQSFSSGLEIIIILSISAAIIWGIPFLLLIPITSSTQIANGFQHIASRWVEPGSPNQTSFEWPEDLSGGIQVVPVHSHNDYWRRVPLFDAIAVGCTGVEADIWLKEGSLLVGHTEDSLKANRTLRSLYVDPLLQILEHQNLRRPAGATPHGVFDSSPKTSLTLLIDIKTDGFLTWPILKQQLEPLRNKGWLTYHNGTTLFPGPVTVVGTGNTPFSLILNDTMANISDTGNAIRREIFFDAPLDSLSSAIYNASNSYYASVSIRKTVGRTRFGTLSRRQSTIIKTQTHLAARFGLKARYWDTQAWPVAWRNRVWGALVEHGVGILDADDVVAASRKDWNRCTVLGVNVC